MTKGSEREEQELAPGSSAKNGSSPSRAWRLRDVKASVISLLLAAGLGAGSYSIAKSTGPDLSEAQQRGIAAGTVAGAEKGAAMGYQAGFKKARTTAYARNYDRSYRNSYATARENAGLTAPQPGSIEVPE